MCKWVSNSAHFYEYACAAHGKRAIPSSPFHLTLDVHTRVAPGFLVHILRLGLGLGLGLTVGLTLRVGVHNGLRASILNLKVALGTLPPVDIKARNRTFTEDKVVGLVAGTQPAMRAQRNLPTIQVVEDNFCGIALAIPAPSVHPIVDDLFGHDGDDLRIGGGLRIHRGPDPTRRTHTHLAALPHHDIRGGAGALRTALHHSQLHHRSNAAGVTLHVIVRMTAAHLGMMTKGRLSRMSRGALLIGSSWIGLKELTYTDCLIWTKRIRFAKV